MCAWANTDNSHIGAKVAIRRHVLEVLTPSATRVLDCFDGVGVMWDHVWREASAYVGCDEQWHNDPRTCYVADNRRVLRCIDLTRFNCFDLDAYGVPWDQLVIITARRPKLAPGERLGLVVTDGCWPHFRAGRIPAALQLLSRTPTVRPLGRTQAQMSKNAKDAVAKVRVERYDDVITRALAESARRFGGRIVREWRATSPTGVYVRYAGLVIEGEARRPKTDAPKD